MVDRIECCTEIKQDQRNDVTVVDRTDDVIRDTDDSCFSTMVSSIGRLFSRKQFVLFSVVSESGRDDFFNYSFETKLRFDMGR